MSRSSTRLGWLALSTGMMILTGFVSACSQHALEKRPQIGVVAGGDDLTEAELRKHDFGFVATDNEAAVTVTINNDGSADLEFYRPELETVDWVWASLEEDDARSFWPVSQLTLGGEVSTLKQLVALLKEDASEDASLVLAQALVRARLVVESGGNRTSVEATLAAAEAWLTANASGRLPFAVQPGSAAGTEAAGFAETLESYAGKANPYLDFDWARSSLTDADFPLQIAPAGERGFYLRLLPQEPRDVRPMVLVLTSNDGFDNEEIRVFLEATERAASIRLDPQAGFFVNPSRSSPGSETFDIHNEGSESLIVDRIYFEREDDDEYALIPPDKPKSDWIVLPKGHAGYEPLTFSVTYGPAAELRDNAVLILSNDAANRTFRVPLTSDVRERALFEITWEGQALGYLDFSERVHGDERTVHVRNFGPSNFNLDRVDVVPAAAAAVYTLRVEESSSSPGVPPTTHPPNELQSLVTGAVRNIVVTYEGTAETPVNGTLVISYRNPADAGTFQIPIIGGEELPMIDIAPTDRPLAFNAVEGDSATATLVLANNGNGGLTIRNVTVYDQWWSGSQDCDTTPDPSAHFSLVEPFAADTVLAPASLTAVPVRFVPTSAEARLIGYAQIAYDDPLAPDPAEPCRIARVTLAGSTDMSSELPVADVQLLTSDPRAGDLVLLDASASTPGAGEFDGSYAWWYLSQKPAGSKMILNDEGGPSLQIVPDQPGTYRINLVLYATVGTTGWLYSDEAYIDVEVLPAAD